MRFEQNLVPLDRIDTEDQTYRITTNPSIADLTGSIQSVGVITPPILKKRNSKFTVVSGFRRISTCRRLNWAQIEARVIAFDADPLTCVKIAVIENALQRPLNLIEQSRCLDMLSAFIPGSKDLSRTASELGLPGNASLLKKIKSICRLPQPIQECILSGTVSLAMAVELGRLENEAGIALARLFDHLKLSLNKQREVITLVTEIAHREEISILEVFEDVDLKAILTDEEIDRNLKTQKVRRCLRRRRFPSITSAENAFEYLANSLTLGTGMKLTPPKSFEGNTYTLSVRFHNLEELKAREAVLKRVIQNPNLRKILRTKS